MTAVHRRSRTLFLCLAATAVVLSPTAAGLVDTAHAQTSSMVPPPNSWGWHVERVLTTTNTQLPTRSTNIFLAADGRAFFSDRCLSASGRWTQTPTLRVVFDAVVTCPRNDAWSIRTRNTLIGRVLRLSFDGRRLTTRVGTERWVFDQGAIFTPELLAAGYSIPPANQPAVFQLSTFRAS